MTVAFVLPSMVRWEVNVGRNTSSSFDAMLKRDEIAFGYKFITGNVGVSGKKGTLPH